MLKRRFDGKTIGTLFIALITMCLSAFAATRSSDEWTLDPSDFRYDMAIYFDIDAQGYNNLDEFEVGAFIDNECRGLAEKIELPEGKTGMYMRIYSNSTAPQEVDFLMRNKQTGKLFHLQEEKEDPVIFKANEMIGMPSDPYIMSIYFDIRISASDNGSVDFTNGLYPAGSEIKFAAVAAEGYHFESWSDGNTEAERTMTVTADLDLTAQFAPNSYKVEFRIGDETIATETFLYGANVTAPEAPAKVGYTFTGWENLPVTMPASDLVITGAYAVNSYKVTFMDGDNEITAQELTFGATITAPEPPAKEGYTFTGWSAFPDTMPAEDLVVTANYSVNTYKVTFSIGSEVIEEAEIAYGSPIIVPEVAEKTGYTFSGWGDVPATMPARDLTFTGTYDLNSYTLTFVIDDVVIEEKQVAFGEPIVAPATPDKEGYKFEGWLNMPETMPAENITIYGTYSANSHLLTFMIDDQIFEESVVLFGAAITAPTVPAKEGYTFSGWGDVPATMPARDLVISGSYVVNTYKLTFSVDNEVIETSDKEFGSEISLPAMPEKEGYTFSGWGDVPATMPARDLTLSASYQINSYRITFKIDGEIVETCEIVYGAAITAPEVQERPGYTFSGWANLPETMPARDLEVTATYRINSYKLTFMIDDVTVEEKELPFGAAIEPPVVPDKEGHKFAGWLNLPTTMPASDLTVLGTYEKNAYVLTFMIDDEIIEQKVMTVDVEITAPEAPAKEGYTFDGWETIPATMPAHDLNIKGSYTINTYRLTFAIDGETVETSQVVYGSEIMVPEAPAKEGYTFAGWDNLPVSMPASDLTVTGSYKINSYKLTIIIDGEIVEEKELPFGAEIVMPATPDKEGHKFQGWFNQVDVMPASDLTITGSYMKDSHLLTFTIDDVVIEERVMLYGDAITAPEAPAKEGYTFTGWETMPETMPASDLTVKGAYAVNTYRLTFAIDGETVEMMQIAYGSEITAPEAPAKEGYTFAGWETMPETMPASDLTVNGSYAINNYKLTIVIDGEIVEEKELPYGAEIVMPATPDKEGHKFQGWFNQVEVMPASDLTITGTYSRNSHLLTFMIDNEIIEERVMLYGDAVTAPEAPAKEGYTFVAWENVPETMPASDLVINGYYKVNSYRISFLVNDEAVSTAELPYGAEITVPVAPAMEGYTFISWGEVPATMPAQDLSFTGIYGINFYKLTIVIDNEVIEETELPYGAEIVMPATPDKEGHKFQGWFNQVDVMPASDLTITGTYLKDSHLLSFVIDDVVIEEKVMLYGDAITAPEAPAKEGYTFAGWESLPETMPAKDLVISGSYKLNSYRISFLVNNEVVETAELPFGAEITVPVAPEVEGYTFVGWGDVPATMPAQDLTLSAVYGINIYKLTIIIDDVIVEETELPFGAEIVMPATPDKEGHKFQGWFNQVGTMPASDLTILGTYVKNTHLLSFVIDDVVIEEKVMLYGDAITAPEAPAKEGYTFAGWENLPETMPAKDLVVNGSYKVNSYIISFLINAETIETAELPYGAEITLPEAPEKEGFTFAGWGDVPATMPARDLTVNGFYNINLYKLTFVIDNEVVEETELPFGAAIVAPATPDKEGHKFQGWFNMVETMPASDLTILGTYTKDSHLLSFVIDGEIIEERVMIYGDVITAPEAPEKEGFTFAGWEDLPETMPAKDLVINGSYDVNYYKLTFYINDEVYFETELAYGEEIVAPEVEVPAEKKFEGWNEEIPATMPARDLAIHGTMIDDSSSSIAQIFGSNATVTVYNLNGVMLFKDVKANEIKNRLVPGIYVINGKKVVIR